MPTKEQAIQEEIKKFQHTKNVFQNCERLLRTATFSGSECMQVADCIQLMQFMVRETTQNIKQMSQSLKQTKVEVPAPPTVTVGDDSDLAPHLPDEEEE